MRFVCVCRFGISFRNMIERIDSKLISECLIIDYSLNADLHICVYGRAECASFSLECTKMKLLIIKKLGGLSLPITHAQFLFIDKYIYPLRSVFWYLNHNDSFFFSKILNHFWLWQESPFFFFKRTYVSSIRKVGFKNSVR